jgi:hypothetical protein
LRISAVILFQVIKRPRERQHNDCGFPSTARHAVISQHDASAKPFTELDVWQTLTDARRTLATLSEPDSFAAWAEILAFALRPAPDGRSPWGTFYGPMGSGHSKDGSEVYFPDIAQADARVIDHWIRRANSLTHPVLKARYADLVWDLAPAITKQPKRNPEMARLAIDTYLTSLSKTIRPELHDRLAAATRAIDVAAQLNDADRMRRARLALMDLHREAVSTKARWVDCKRRSKNPSVKRPIRVPPIIARSTGPRVSPERCGNAYAVDALRARSNAVTFDP